MVVRKLQDESLQYSLFWDLSSTLSNEGDGVPGAMFATKVPKGEDNK